MKKNKKSACYPNPWAGPATDTSVMIDWILRELAPTISLGQLSVLRSSLPNFLEQLFEQKPDLLGADVVQWLVEGIRSSSEQ